jgi:hypothetical protein
LSESESASKPAAIVRYDKVWLTAVVFIGAVEAVVDKVAAARGRDALAAVTGELVIAAPHLCSTTHGNLSVRDNFTNNNKVEKRYY